MGNCAGACTSDDEVERNAPTSTAKPRKALPLEKYSRDLLTPMAKEDNCESFDHSFLLMECPSTNRSQTDEQDIIISALRRTVSKDSPHWRQLNTISKRATSRDDLLDRLESCAPFSLPKHVKELPIDDAPPAVADAIRANRALIQLRTPTIGASTDLTCRRSCNQRRRISNSL